LLTADVWYGQWRKRELARLDRLGITYLDYTGTPPYPVSIVRQDAERLDGEILGNPHSENGPSQASTRDLESARAAILRFLNADAADYGVVLTANASAACRLVGEAWPFGPRRPLILAQDNHNSVNGLREFARARDARVATVPLDPDLRLTGAERVLVEHARSIGGLFAFPAQSNFSGVRHSLDLVPLARSLGHRTLLDAAGFLPTATLDLSRVPADFVVLSIYKITGYPTGIGALVARHDALAELERPWFAGGTVDWVSVGGGRHRLRPGVQGFEDGTPPFLAAGAVAPALETILGVDRPRLAGHLEALAGELLRGLTCLRHANGAPLVVIHGPRDVRDRGATIAITLRDPKGKVLPYWSCEADARKAGLAVRGGCFCNPGCAEAAFGWAAGETAPCLDSLGAGFTIPKFAECLGDGPVGAIRLSLGLGSLRRDVDVALAFLRGYVDRIDCRAVG